MICLLLLIGFYFKFLSPMYDLSHGRLYLLDAKKNKARSTSPAHTSKITACLCRRNFDVTNKLGRRFSSYYILYYVLYQLVIFFINIEKLHGVKSTNFVCRSQINSQVECCLCIVPLFFQRIVGVFLWVCESFLATRFHNLSIFCGS